MTKPMVVRQAQYVQPPSCSLATPYLQAAAASMPLLALVCAWFTHIAACEGWVCRLGAGCAVPAALLLSV
jgi:hypothetical protein